MADGTRTQAPGETGDCRGALLPGKDAPSCPLPPRIHPWIHPQPRHHRTLKWRRHASVSFEQLREGLMRSGGDFICGSSTPLTARRSGGHARRLRRQHLGCPDLRLRPEDAGIAVARSDSPGRACELGPAAGHHRCGGPVIPDGCFLRCSRHSITCAERLECSVSGRSPGVAQLTVCGMLRSLSLHASSGPERPVSKVLQT